MLLLGLEPDGSRLRMFLSAAYDVDNDSVFKPKELHRILLENAGSFPASCQIWQSDEGQFKCMYGCWEGVA